MNKIRIKTLPAGFIMLLLALLYLQQTPTGASVNFSNQVEINVDAGKSIGPLKRMWTDFGTSWRNYLSFRRKDPGPPYTLDFPRFLDEIRPEMLRLHETGPNGFLVQCWPQTKADFLAGNYNWALLDTLVKDVRSRTGVNTQFMHVIENTPAWLRPPNTWYNTPPDLSNPIVKQAWIKLITDTVLYLSQNHGVQYWEIWNEPDLQSFHFKGTADDYIELYEVTVGAIKAADPNAKVGGPTIVSNNLNKWMVKFITECVHRGLPLDFISWHRYGNWRDGLKSDMQIIQNAITGTPYENIELLLDEYNAQIYNQNPTPIQAGIKNGHYESSFFLASYVLAAQLGIDQLFHWQPASEDATEKNGLFLADLVTPKPIYNFYKLCMMMPATQIQAASSDADIIVVSAADNASIGVIGTYFIDSKYPWGDTKGPDYSLSKDINFSIQNIPFADWYWFLYRIDMINSNGIPAGAIPGYNSDGGDPELELIEWGQGNISSFQAQRSIPSYGIIFLQIVDKNVVTQLPSSSQFVALPKTYQTNPAQTRQITTPPKSDVYTGTAKTTPKGPSLPTPTVNGLQTQFLPSVKVEGKKASNLINGVRTTETTFSLPKLTIDSPHTQFMPSVNAEGVKVTKLMNGIRTAETTFSLPTVNIEAANTTPIIPSFQVEGISLLPLPKEKSILKLTLTPVGNNSTLPLSVNIGGTFTGSIEIENITQQYINFKLTLGVTTPDEQELTIPANLINFGINPILATLAPQESIKRPISIKTPSFYQEGKNILWIKAEELTDSTIIAPATIIAEDSIDVFVKSNKPPIYE